jgi:hypothetical protein
LSGASVRPTRWTFALCLVACALATPVGAQKVAPLPAGARAVLDRFAGTWDVTLTVRRPKPAVVTYMQTSAWVLDHHFVRGETAVRPDGSHEVSMFGYEPASRSYPLWIFFSSGFAAYLQRGEWDEASRTMSWKSAAADLIQFSSRCTFEGATTLRCSTQVKDGKGGLALEQESIAVRRR